MATYKVPQDVEADDKLIGPFSFRQFIYLIIVAMCGLAAWGLAQLFIGLVIIPIPVMIFFGALALPLRKDQPMEIYMAAMVSFYLKPRQRLWDPEGVETLIEISAPKTVELRRTKDLSQVEAEQRLSYLANIVDSQGWAIRGASGAMGTAMNNDAYLEAQGAEDVLDTNTSIARSFDQMMTQSTERMHEEAKERMLQATLAQQTTAPQQPIYQAPVTQFVPNQYTQQTIQQPQYQQPSEQVTNGIDPLQFAPPASVAASNPTTEEPHFNPYPDIHQSVIQPLGDALHQAESMVVSEVSNTPPVISQEETPPSTSDTALSAGIMNLAKNSEGLSVETIAHEAHRLKKKAEDESEEVVISLR